MVQRLKVVVVALFSAPKLYGGLLVWAIITYRKVGGEGGTFWSGMMVEVTYSSRLVECRFENR